MLNKCCISHTELMGLLHNVVCFTLKSNKGEVVQEPRQPACARRPGQAGTSLAAGLSQHKALLHCRSPAVPSSPLPQGGADALSCKEGREGGNTIACLNTLHGSQRVTP